MKKAIVPGTFDPVTNGHLDVITRASQMFDEIVVAVAVSEKKKPIFPLEKRVELLEEAVKDIPNVTVKPFDDLLIHFAQQEQAGFLVKGLRALTDFEYEFAMTSANYRMDPSIETVFVMSPPQYMYLSSSIIREIASFHGNLHGAVPKHVEKALQEYFS